MILSKLFTRRGLAALLALALVGGGLAVGDRVGPVAAQGTLLLQDDFSKKDSGWPESNDEFASTQYSGGEYVITVKTTNPYAAFGPHSLVLRDFDLTVNFRFITPSDVANGYAMFVWRYGATDTTTVYYTLFLDPYSSPNQCRFQRFNSGQVVTLLTAPCAGIFETGSDEWNELHVTVRGADMTFIINDVKVADLRDRFLRDGRVGLGAVNRGNPTGMKVAWDDLKIYAPEAAPTWTNTPRPTPTEAPEMPTEEPTSTTLPSETPRPTRLPTEEPTAVRPTRTPGPSPTPAPNTGGKLYLPSLMRVWQPGTLSDGYRAYSPRWAMYAATPSGSW